MKNGNSMKLNKMTADGKIAYLIKPILKVLQEAGGQLERSEIKERIADLDDQIAEFAENVKQSQKPIKSLILNLILQLRTCFSMIW